MILGLTTTWGQSQEEDKAAPFKDGLAVVKVRIDDFDNSQKIRDWERLMKALQEQQPKSVLFDLNVKGYLPWDSQEKILESMSLLKVPTIAYVNSSATGVGALMAISCDTIYVSGSGLIGGAGLKVPASIKEADAQKRAMAQDLSLLKARARSIAKNKGHRVDVVEAFIDSDIEIKSGDDIISKKDEILTLTASEAIKKVGGKSLLAKGLASSREVIVKKEKLGAANLVAITLNQFTRDRNRERLGVNKKTGDDASKANAESTPEAKEEKGLFTKSKGENYSGKIVVIPVGEKDLRTGEARFEFMNRIIKKAQIDKAEAVIFDIDTPGGYAWFTQSLVLNNLQDVSIPTFSFVNTRAVSAGAIVALGTDSIYMRPGATIGSALVVSGGGDIEGDMKSKINSNFIDFVRNIAEIKGHNLDIAEAFVSREKEVRIGGSVVHEAGEVLSLSTTEATEMIDGRPVLAKGVADSLEDIVEMEGLKGEVVTASTLGLEGFAQWVQKFSAILLVIGIAGVYMEVKSPGFALPGAIGLLAFGLYFFGNNMAGKLAGFETAVIFILGIVLICVEIFLFPGLMIPGLVGGMMVIGSLLFAYVDKVDFQWKVSEKLPGSVGELFGGGLVTISLALIMSAIVIAVLMQFLPKTKFGRLLVLDEAVPAGASIDGQIMADSTTRERESFLGWEGEAVTDLRPAGKGRFQGKLLDIIADGEYVEKDHLIKIIKHEGSRIVVKKID